MLRPITLVCQPALDACHALQTRLVLWLCEPARVPADVTEANLRALNASPIVGDWLIEFLNKEYERVTLLSRAVSIAGLPVADKALIVSWLNSSNNTANQFQNPPPAWPQKPACSIPHAWNSVKDLLTQFYSKGLGEGLPFDQNGNPVAAGGVNRGAFVAAFKQAHGDRSCVLCDGPIGQPEVDHWIAKKHFPGLSTAAHNLIPICHDCNSRANKGEKPVWQSAGNAFDDWFHPVFRPAHGCLIPTHRTMQRVVVTPTSSAHAQRVQKLDGLVKLSQRWTSEFKSQSRAYKNTLRGQIIRGKIQTTTIAIASELQELQLRIADENPLEANSIIRNLTLSILQEPAKLDALLVELTT
jgi:hypothetical protein